MGVENLFFRTIAYGKLAAYLEDDEQYRAMFTLEPIVGRKQAAQRLLSFVRRIESTPEFSTLMESLSLEEGQIIVQEARQLAFTILDTMVRKPGSQQKFDSFIRAIQ